MTNPAPSGSSSSNTSEPTAEAGGVSGGVVRPAILTVVLLIVGGMWLVDFYVFKPATEAAEKKLEEAVRVHNLKSIEESKDKPFVTRTDVEQALGRAPTRTTLIGDNLVEYYCWWGSLPLKRRYIAVAYKDREGAKYHTHLLDAEVQKSDLPLSNKEALELAEKALQESPNGPDRQMPVPDATTSVPAKPALESPDNIPADNPSADTAPTDNAPTAPNTSDDAAAPATTAEGETAPVDQPSTSPPSSPEESAPESTGN
jgi:hypothetical protein